MPFNLNRSAELIAKELATGSQKDLEKVLGKMASGNTNKKKMLPFIRRVLKAQLKIRNTKDGLEELAGLGNEGENEYDETVQ
jgi:hypothetical protein